MAAPGDIDFNDLSVDLDNEESAVEVDDIPVEGEEPEATDEEGGLTGDILETDQGGIGEDAPQAPAPTPAPKPPKENADLKKTEKALSKAKEVVTKANLAELEINIVKLKKENDLMFKEISELKEVVQEFLLFRIPKYEEMEIPESRLNPEVIFTYVTNALDKRLLKIFEDVPVYNARKFSILEKDNNNNIVNALMTVEISFDKHSRFAFLRFDLELFIIDGYLNIPGWFMYEGKLYTLNQDGVRRIDMVNTRFEEEDTSLGKPRSWYDANANQKNPIYPSNIHIPETTHLPNQNFRSNRRNF